MILNKPYGIPVHKVNFNENDVISILKFIKPKELKLNLVHRLDKETSGILLISKNHYTLKCLHEQFRNNLICKKYLALVNGKWNPKNELINKSLTKCNLHNKKNISKIDIDGKESLTVFKIKEEFLNFTLMDIKLITGRFHQIRLHAKYCGNPIVLDKLYGLKNINLKIKKLGLNRLFLHACSIKFIHPVYNNTIFIESPLDNDLYDFIKYIRKNKI